MCVGEDDSFHEEICMCALLSVFSVQPTNISFFISRQMIKKPP